jgi:heptosyltransferase I
MPNWLGDIVMAFPFLQYLKQQFPTATIILIIKPNFAELMQLLPFKVRILTFDKKKHGGLAGLTRFCLELRRELRKEFQEINSQDLYITLSPSYSAALMGVLLRIPVKIGTHGEWGRGVFLTKSLARNISKIHRAQEFCHLLKLICNKSEKNYELICDLNLELLSNDFLKIQNGPYWVVNATSEASSRRVPILEWRSIFERIKEKKRVGKLIVALVGTENQKESLIELEQTLEKLDIEIINLAGKTSILELASVLKNAEKVISNDSGPAHLASLMGTDVCVFFGAGDSKQTAPIRFKKERRITVLEKKVACSPCLRNYCKRKDLICLRELAKDVFIDDLL